MNIIGFFLEFIQSNAPKLPTLLNVAQKLPYHIYFFLGMLGVPAKHKTPELLQFTAPCHSELEMMRVIQYKDVPNQYMVLLRFRCQAAADEFYQAFNGLPYNSFESEICSLVYISKVETCKESEFYPLSNHTELPVCSICLERKLLQTFLFQFSNLN